ncbi:MAG: hypothetical protein WC861_01560 [Candidatus Micrarchaeia archaeon]|jgi:predicted Zn-dependent protease
MNFKLGKTSEPVMRTGVVVHVSLGVLEVEKQIVLEAINWAVRIINAKLSLEVKPLEMKLLYRYNRLLLEENLVMMFESQKGGELKYHVLITPQSALEPGWLSYGKDGYGCIISTASPRMYGYSGKESFGTEFLERLTLHESGHMFGANHCAKDSCVMEQTPGNFRNFARKNKIANPKPFCRDCWDLMNKAPVPKKFVIPQKPKPKFIIGKTIR